MTAAVVRTSPECREGARAHRNMPCLDRASTSMSVLEVVDEESEKEQGVEHVQAERRLTG
jgi:hypothetical protein